MPTIYYILISVISNGSHEDIVSPVNF